MFLDAWLALYLGGIGALVLLLLLVFMGGCGLVLGYRLRRLGRRSAASIATLLSMSLLVATTAFVGAALIDSRVEKHLVLDLRRTSSLLLADLITNCAKNRDDENCDSNRFTFNVTVVFATGEQVSIAPTSIYWSRTSATTVGYIKLMTSDSMTPSQGREALLDHAALLAHQANDAVQVKIDHAEKWLGQRNNHVAYSETLEVPLRPELRLVFRKNFDRIYMDYALTPGT
ncbi:hypothetical protein DBR12_09735 [Acidovorax sp. HMWF029]|uniref:hypothetical protein n=1 Tax=Acidovorax sp. HMWF029 TaxID=2056863 RepID=UPI000D3C03F3|nr:hypothetical protein [Acidovorax sp. HMWF029]PTT20338.1 hypothetical protein DBR12_09735 [Acidovorax sp. HMWF029]